MGIPISHTNSSGRKSASKQDTMYARYTITRVRVKIDGVHRHVVHVIVCDRGQPFADIQELRKTSIWAEGTGLQYYSPWISARSAARHQIARPLDSASARPPTSQKETSACRLWCTLIALSLLFAAARTPRTAFFPPSTYRRSHNHENSLARESGTDTVACDGARCLVFAEACNTIAHSRW